MPIAFHTICGALGLDGQTWPPQNPDILHVTADSRTVQPGSLFVAVPGGQVDGHAYVKAALTRGAAAILGERPRGAVDALAEPVAQSVPYVQVADARTALAWACAALEGFPSRGMTVVGVTGTDGKTTTCTLLEGILNAATQTQREADGQVGVITTVGARIRGEEMDTGFHVTTPDAPDVQRFLAQMRDRGCTYAIVESTSHGLAQARVAAVDFDVAAVTNITHEHLDYHGTREAYVAAKALLFRSLFQRTAKTEAQPAAVPFAVLNGDDGGSYGSLRAVLAEETAGSGRDIPAYVYGIVPAARARIAADVGNAPVGAEDALTAAVADYAVCATAVDYFADRTEIRVQWWGGEFALVSTLIGEFNVYNILCAATVGLGLGLEPAVIAAGIGAVSGVVGRMERMDAGQPFLAVVDFAHSPVSLERALLTLRPLVGTRPDGTPGQLIAVFGCAGLRDRAKRRLMGLAGGRLADHIVVTAEDPRTERLEDINREIVEGLVAAGAAGNYIIIDDRTAAIQHAVQMAQPGDVVAAFGKGHERSMCFGTTEYPWSDQDAMLDALRGRG